MTFEDRPGGPHPNPCRLHVTGASGAGTTTLARAVATAWSVPHADTDDYFWLPTTPPYVAKRDPAERLGLMDEVFVGRNAWVLSGSLMGWGEPLLEHIDAVVFVSLDHQTRMERLHSRETLRYGEAIAPGGEREADYRDFMTWADGYEDATFDGRNRAQHEEWLGALDCPVLHLDSAVSVEQLQAAVLEWVPDTAG